MEGLGESDVHGIVPADVVSQPPHAREEVEMGGAMQIELAEICDGFGGAAGRHFRSYSCLNASTALMRVARRAGM